MSTDEKTLFQLILGSVFLKPTNNAKTHKCSDRGYYAWMITTKKSTTQRSFLIEYISIGGETQLNISAMLTLEICFPTAIYLTGPGWLFRLLKGGRGRFPHNTNNKLHTVFWPRVCSVKGDTTQQNHPLTLFTFIHSVLISTKVYQIF